MFDVENKNHVSFTAREASQRLYSADNMQVSLLNSFSERIDAMNALRYAPLLANKRCHRC